MPVWKLFVRMLDTLLDNDGNSIPLRWILFLQRSKKSPRNVVSTQWQPRRTDATPVKEIYIWALKERSLFVKPVLYLRTQKLQDSMRTTPGPRQPVCDNISVHDRKWNSEHIEQGQERNLPGAAFRSCARENWAVKLVHMAQRPPRASASTALRYWS